MATYDLKMAEKKSTGGMHKVKWRNLWWQYDLYVVGHHGVLCEVKWWRFVVLFEWNSIS